jgi:glucokinase
MSDPVRESDAAPVIGPKQAAGHVTGRAPALVYDVGGSHISAAICDPLTFALHGISRAPLPAASEPNSSAGHFSAASFGRLIHTLGEAAASAANISLAKLAGAALAIPGPFDYDRGISQMRHKLPTLFGVDLKSALAARFGWQPSQVRFVNDAAAFLLGEMGAGAAKGYSRAIGITLGTGIGCAFAIDDGTGGHIISGGSEGVPPGGEIWNLPYNGATVEDFVSTRFLRRQYESPSGHAVPGQDLETAAEVAEIARIVADGTQNCPDLDPSFDNLLAGRSSKPSNPADPNSPNCRARRAFQIFGRHLALALNQHAAAFAPDVIVLGGGISRAAPLFLPAMRKALAGFSPKIVISTLMDEAPLAGAGVHWFTASAHTTPAGQPVKPDPNPDPKPDPAVSQSPAPLPPA